MPGHRGRGATRCSLAFAVLLYSPSWSTSSATPWSRCGRAARAADQPVPARRGLRDRAAAPDRRPRGRHRRRRAGSSRCSSPRSPTASPSCSTPARSGALLARALLLSNLLGRRLQPAARPAAGRRAGAVGGGLEGHRPASPGHGGRRLARPGGRRRRPGAALPHRRGGRGASRPGRRHLGRPARRVHLGRRQPGRSGGRRCSGRSRALRARPDPSRDPGAGRRCRWPRRSGRRTRRAPAGWSWSTRRATRWASSARPPYGDAGRPPAWVPVGDLSRRLEPGTGRRPTCTGEELLRRPHGPARQRVPRRRGQRRRSTACSPPPTSSGR